MVDNNFNYSVSVDCVIFGYDDSGLKVLLIKRGVKPYKDYWALPGDLVHPKESIDGAVDRVLKDLTGLSNIYTEQVKTFGDVGRHPLGRVFTISHYSLLKADEYSKINSSYEEARRIIESLDRNRRQRPQIQRSFSKSNLQNEVTTTPPSIFALDAENNESEYTGNKRVG